MIRKQFVFFVILLGLLSISLPAAATTKDSLVSYQGELQGTDGTPVPDGFHAIVFSLYTQPDGGIPIWTEMQDVSTSGGLFNAMLGTHTPFALSMFNNDSLYLSTQVAGGSELLPRLRIGTVPSAAISSRVDGDVVTQPGSLEIWSPSSNTSLRFHATDDAASIAIDEPGVHITQMVNPDSTVFDQGSDSNNRVMIHKIHAGENRMAQMIYPESLVAEQTAVYGSSSAESRLHVFSGGLHMHRSFSNGLSINDVDEDCDGISAKHAINTKGTGGTRTMSVSSSTDLSSASSVVGGDLDGDGIPESFTLDISTADSSVHEVSFGFTNSLLMPALMKAKEKANRTKCSSNLRYFTPVDFTESELSCDSGGAQLGLRVGNIGSSGQDGVEISARLDGSSSIRCDHDSDDDGVSDAEVTQSVTPTTAGVAIKTKGTGAEANRTMSVTSSTNELGASSVCAGDLDGDGISDVGVSSDAIETRSILKTYFEKGDMPTQSQVTNIADVTGARVAIKTKGTGASNARMVSSSTSLDEATLALEGDLDGDGVPENYLEQRCGSDSVVQNAGIDDGGSSSSYNVRVRLNELETRLQNIGLLSRSSVSTACDASGARLAIKTKGTSAKRLSAGGDCDDGDAVLYVDCDDDNDGVADRSVSSSADDSASMVVASEGSVQAGMKVVNKGAIKGNINIMSANRAVVDFDSDGDGYLDNSLGIGVDATHHIDVIGGAYCDGSNWVNASDANLKENFSEVNGEELLSKIDELPVSERNYKNDNQNVKHIGPTAQDFQRAFGVGSDGKSISTIDPSGIALAAIKELNKQNQQLQNQNSELQKRLEDLQKKVDKLISRQ